MWKDPLRGMCYRLLVASDRKMPLGAISDRVHIVEAEPTSDASRHFDDGSFVADIITATCACDLAGDPNAMGAQAAERQGRVHQDYLAIADWVEQQVVHRHRPIWMYLCWEAEIDQPPTGTVEWNFDDLRAPGACLPERARIQFKTGE